MVRLITWYSKVGLQLVIMLIVKPFFTMDDSALAPYALDEALIKAAYHNALEDAKTLVARGAHINCHDSLYGRTPLMWAAHYAYQDNVKLLVSCTDDTQAKPYERTMANWDPHYKHLELIKFLIKHDADLYAKDRTEKTALDLAKAAYHFTQDFRCEDIMHYLENCMAKRARLYCLLTFESIVPKEALIPPYVLFPPEDIDGILKPILRATISEQ